jgi:signal transduction histidine kinase
MIRRVFQQRSGRVIAGSRALLAAFFTLAIALDPGQAGEQTRTILLLLSGYTLFACLMSAVTWNSWWLEARLALLAHAVDLIVFTVLVALTDGYISPFFIFYVFLVLSSTIRGGWREALVTLGLVALLFVVAAVVTASTSSDSEGIEIQRFVLRGAHLLVVSFMIIWFGLSQRVSSQGRAAMLSEDAFQQEGPPISLMIDHAARRLNSARVVLAWHDVEEPWLYVATRTDDRFEQEKFGPEEYPPLVDEDIGKRPFLFDIAECRVLVLREGLRQAMSGRNPLTASFAARFGIDAGLGIPIRTDSYEGYLFASDISGVSSDDLRLAEMVGEEISTAFERSALFSATREAAATRTRGLLARDLHDSVVQFLAGLGLRLEGLKRSAGGSPAIVEEIDDMQHQLVQEQQDLRGLIAALRNAGPSDPHLGLADKLRELGVRLERQWDVKFDFELDVSLSIVPTRLHHDAEQLVREAVANAVRHGQATRVSIAASVLEGHVRLNISDDGQGFPVEGEFENEALDEGRIGPRSLHERVHLLGGSMRLSSSREAGSKLCLTLPLEDFPA